jgi:hypothetical protein
MRLFSVTSNKDHPCSAAAQRGQIHLSQRVLPLARQFSNYYHPQLQFQLQHQISQHYVDSNFPLQDRRLLHLVISIWLAIDNKHL